MIGEEPFQFVAFDVDPAADPDLGAVPHDRFGACVADAELERDAFPVEQAGGCVGNRHPDT